MKINIKDIHFEGLEFDGQISSDLIGAASKDDLRFTGPFDVHAKVSRDKDTIFAKTHVRGQYTAVCGRCLAEIKEILEGNFLFDYLVEPEMEFVELDEDIRQEVVLSLSIRVLCKSDCKGICLNCGADLNNETCKCNDTRKDAKIDVEIR